MNDNSLFYYLKMHSCFWWLYGQQVTKACVKQFIKIVAPSHCWKKPNWKNETVDWNGKKTHWPWIKNNTCCISILLKSVTCDFFLGKAFDIDSSLKLRAYHSVICLKAYYSKTTINETSMWLQEWGMLKPMDVKWMTRNGGESGVPLQNYT